MYCLRFTPLWRIEKTEDWLNSQAAQGFRLAGVFGPIYKLNKPSDPNRDIRYWFDFYEQGSNNNLSGLLQTRFQATDVAYTFSFYTISKYKTSVNKQRRLAIWKDARDLLVKDALVHRILCAILAAVCGPVVFGSRFGVIVGSAILLACVAYGIINVFGLICVAKRLAKQDNSRNI